MSISGIVIKYGERKYIIMPRGEFDIPLDPINAGVEAQFRAEDIEDQPLIDRAKLERIRAMRFR